MKKTKTDSMTGYMGLAVSSLGWFVGSIGNPIASLIMIGVGSIIWARR